MSALARVCVILASVGALNWVVGWFLNEDFAVKFFGAERAVGSDALRILIGLASIYALLAAFGFLGRRNSGS